MYGYIAICTCEPALWNINTIKIQIVFIFVLKSDILIKTGGAKNEGYLFS